MTANLFAAEAPRYWAAGLPVIPLYPKQKRPVLTAWTEYCRVGPTDEERAGWLETCADGNIGLPCGPAAGVVCMDVDTDNPVARQVIEQVLPPSPYRKVGMKGYTAAYRFTGHRAFKIRDARGAMLIECLSTGNHTVLPPSIHPDTGKPYTSNVHLADVLDELLPLPDDIETMLRTAFKQAGIDLSLYGRTNVVEYISKGSRDVQMCRVAGAYVRGIFRGDITFKRAMDAMLGWFDACQERVAGDDLPPEKGIQKLVDFVKSDLLNNKLVLPPKWDEGLTDAEKVRFGLDRLGEDAEEWTADEIQHYLLDVYDRPGFGPDSQARADEVEKMVVKLANSPTMPGLVIDRLLRWMASTSQVRFTFASLKERMAQAKLGGIKGLNHAEVAEKVLEELEKFGQVRFARGHFWRWSGSHYEKLETSFILSLIATDFGAYPATKKASDHGGVLKIMQALRDRPLADTDTPGVNFANGYLTFEGEFLAHSADFGMTYTLPFRYLPEKSRDCHRFFEFLKQCWSEDGDYEDKVKALQEAFCAALMGMGPILQRVLLLEGPGGTGKSQCLAILTGLMPPDVVTSIPPTDWSDKFLITELSTSRLNLAGELSEYRKISGDKFKGIVDGTVVTGQYKHQNPFKFACQAFHVFASNHLPKTLDTSSGFSRRWLILRFLRVVPKEERVLGLGETIVAEEREAIAAWAVAAAERLRFQKDFTLPRSHVEAVEQMEDSNCSVSFFLRRSGKCRLVAPTTEPSICAQQLYSVYSIWATMSAGVAKPVPFSVFSPRIQALAKDFGFSAVKGRGADGMETLSLKGITLASERAAA